MTNCKAAFATTGVVAIVFMAGCGSGETSLTKAQVIRQGSAICRAGERAVEALPAPTSETPFATGTSASERRHAVAFLAGYATALAHVRAGLAALKAPSDDRTQLRSFIAQLGPAVAAFRAAQRDGEAGHGEKAQAEAQAGFARFATASRETAAYGFPKGVCQSGA